MIVDYRGRIVGEQRYGGGSTYGGRHRSTSRRCATTAATRPVGQLDEGPRTELYQLVYEEPIYPKNLYLERAPYTTRSTAAR